MIPGRYPIGTHWVSQGGKNDPRCFKKWNACCLCLCIPFGEMLTGLVPSLKVSANTLHKQNEHVFTFSETPPQLCSLFFFPVIPGGYFPNIHGKKKKKKTSEQICRAYTYLYI
jgi:hypothetical protein